MSMADDDQQLPKRDWDPDQTIHVNAETWDWIEKELTAFRPPVKEPDPDES
jgi:hypothetical protein